MKQFLQLYPNYKQLCIRSINYFLMLGLLSIRYLVFVFIFLGIGIKCKGVMALAEATKGFTVSIACLPPLHY